MADGIALTGFIVAAFLFTLLWGRILWYFDEKSKRINRLVFYLMTFTRLTFPEIKSLVLSLIYYVFGVTGMLIFSMAYRIDLLKLFTFKFHFFPLILLGIIAEITLSIFSTHIYLKSVQGKRVNPFAEIHEAPWINGILKLPRALVPIAPVLGGLMEEIFFRGILLVILVTQLSISPMISILMVTGLFLVEQWIQLRTLAQRIMIGLGSFSISFIGGILVIYTGSIIPAAIAHMSFVIFYFGYSFKTSSGYSFK
ncbi:MAG: type II CAAX prenyl endopeptidase Rce1 family protein [Candidatus Omnitrophota bacterium]